VKYPAVSPIVPVLSKNDELEVDNVNGDETGGNKGAPPSILNVKAADGGGNESNVVATPS